MKIENRNWVLVWYEIQTIFRTDISPVGDFYTLDNFPFVAVQGQTMLRSCVCTPGQISVHI